MFIKKNPTEKRNWKKNCVEIKLKFMQMEWEKYEFFSEAYCHKRN